MQQTIQLLTTAGCHLCEQAEAMVNFLLKNNLNLSTNFHLKLVEIAHDDFLVEEYGIRIPVLKIESSEIGWPFELEQLEVWFKEQINGSAKND